MNVATEYLVLRGLASSSRIQVPLERKPLRVATLLDEAKFLASGGQLRHQRTVFLEDRMHDWNWNDGMFRYYSRCGGPEDKLDVLIVYAFEDHQFCFLCGGVQHSHYETCPAKEDA